MTTAHLMLMASMLPDRPGMGECVEFQFVGLIVVLSALTMLWLICELAGVAFRSARVREVASFGGGDVFDDGAEEDVVRAAVIAAAHAVLGPGHRVVSTVSTVPVVPSLPARDEDAVEAAVAAAVHAALGPGHRVASVRLRHDAAVGTWSAEGRRQHFQSHKVR